MLGTYVLSAGYYDAYYGRAQRVRRLIARDFAHVFASGVDAVFTPTTPTTAFRIGERTDDPYEMYLSDVFTVTANLAGIPALSLPIGTVDGLPIGGQLMGRPWGERTLVEIASALESDLGMAATGRLSPRSAPTPG
jgi:aspartyl-tRNA(Asn)/glutamyl-tRNA(Gln) amidotransferase subunit A